MILLSFTVLQVLGHLDSQKGYKIGQKLHIIVKMVLHAAFVNYPMSAVSRPQRYFIL